MGHAALSFRSFSLTANGAKRIQNPELELLLLEMFGEISCRQTMKTAHGLLFSTLAVSWDQIALFFLADFQQIIQRKCGKLIKVNKQDVPDLVFSLLQVLLSGLIGVVSWKRPLSLVVSFHRTPPPVTLEPVSLSARRVSEHAGGVFIWPLVQVRPSSAFTGSSLSGAVGLGAAATPQSYLPSAPGCDCDG